MDTSDNIQSIVADLGLQMGNSRNRVSFLMRLRYSDSSVETPVNKLLLTKRPWHNNRRVLCRQPRKIVCHSRLLLQSINKLLTVFITLRLERLIVELLNQHSVHIHSIRLSCHIFVPFQLLLGTMKIHSECSYVQFSAPTILVQNHNVIRYSHKQHLFYLYIF